MAKKTILIVEDEQHIANAEKLILGDKYNIHTAYDGEEGLKMAKKIMPDLIILDLMLPNRGGYDLCFNLRQDNVMNAIKILMVTAKDKSIDKDKGVMVGADDYLTKPFEAEELQKRVRTLLENG